MSFLHPKPLEPDVVDRLFSALTLRYGGPFLDRWRELDLSVVKSDWARQLAGFGPASFRFALDSLPEKPPTVIDFRKLCNQAPIEHAPALPYNQGPTRGPTAAEREKLRRLAADIRAGRAFAKPSRQWAYDLIACHESGWRESFKTGHRVMQRFQCTPTSLAMAKDAIATDPDRWERAPLQRQAKPEAFEEEPF